MCYGSCRTLMQQPTQENPEQFPGGVFFENEIWKTKIIHRLHPHQMEMVAFFLEWLSHQDSTPWGEVLDKIWTQGNICLPLTLYYFSYLTLFEENWVVPLVIIFQMETTFYLSSGFVFSLSNRLWLWGCSFMCSIVCSADLEVVAWEL